MTAEEYQLIIQGDFNSEYEVLKLWMIELSPADLIGKKHGKGPRAYTHCKDAPIDCIFGKSNFKILRGGYLSFGRLASDHRSIWVHIPHFIITGYNTPKLVWYMTRRLKLADL